MPGRIANEAVGNAVPAGADGLVGKRGQVIRSADDTGERLLGRIDRNSQGVPRAGSDSANRFPLVSISNRKLGCRGAALNGQRLDDASPEIKTKGAGFGPVIPGTGNPP